MVGVADHAAQAGASGSEVVFEVGHALLELFAACGELTVLVDQVLVVLGELVDSGEELLMGGLVELAAELFLKVVAEFVPLGSQILDFLSGQFQVGV